MSAEEEARRRLDEATQAAAAADKKAMAGSYSEAHRLYVLALTRLKAAESRSPSNKEAINAKFMETLAKTNEIAAKLDRPPYSPDDISADIKSTTARIQIPPAAPPPSGIAYPELLSYPDPTSTHSEIPAAGSAQASGSGSTSTEESKKRRHHHRSHSGRKAEQFNLSEHIVKIADYKKVKVLGHGSFGSVYCAQERSSGKLVAVKILQTEFLNQEDQVAFLREVENLVHAAHPAVLKFVGFSLRCSDEEPCPAIVTEYLPNGSIQDILDGKRKINATQKLIILYGIAEAMRYLHDRLDIVHRDLKPGNVMLSAENEPIVGDFGLSKIMKERKMRQSMVSGSPVYMAPELMERKEYTNKVDVYAFGIMAYEIVTGILAYDDIATVQELVTQVCMGLRPLIPKAVPSNYSSLMVKCWSADVQERPSFKEICKMYRDGMLNLAGADMEAFQAYVKKLSESRRSK